MQAGRHFVFWDTKTCALLSSRRMNARARCDALIRKDACTLQCCVYCCLQTSCCFVQILHPRLPIMSVIGFWFSRSNFSWLKFRLTHLCFYVCSVALRCRRLPQRQTRSAALQICTLRATLIHLATSLCLNRTNLRWISIARVSYAAWTNDLIQSRGIHALSIVSIASLDKGLTVTQKFCLNEAMTEVAKEMLND